MLFPLHCHGIFPLYLKKHSLNTHTREAQQMYVYKSIQWNDVRDFLWLRKAVKVSSAMWGFIYVIKNSWLRTGVIQIAEIIKHYQTPGALDRTCE